MSDRSSKLSETFGMLRKVSEQVILRENSQYLSVNPRSVGSCPDTDLQQGAEVTMDKKKGVIVSSKSLVLQNVTRHQAGPYQCHAVNTEGDNTSNTATLRVMCEYCLESSSHV